MKKIFAFIFFTFFIVKSFAQLDTEHWFAPMMDRVKNGSYVQTLYFSTNATTPFPVTIYNNNVAIGTVTVSKGNPQKFVVNRNYMITTSQNDLFTPTTMGLYCKGDQPFFANFRFSESNHAEILTSKGKAGIGKKFYAAMAPITYRSNLLNFMTGILATEDNTTVTISGYKPTVLFSSQQGSTITFTLNKGQSYIIDASGENSNNSPYYSAGFIGAKIVSDKPVSVTNGNFNGQYAGNYNNSDILMDQSVPVERLGSEFALIKGNGNIGDKMEGGIIIATEDRTEIYLNKDTVPIATLDEGQFYQIPESNYQKKSNDVYNMYVRATKNVYLYQLLAGASSSTVQATGGFNYIPPLSCYLPKEINEIGLIDENLTYSTTSPAGELNIPTKLNIITEEGAEVKVNGNIPDPNDGPFPLEGNNVWVTYSIPNVSGNITITSTKAVTAGIAAGDGAVGYGGYFAGFSSIPAIAKQTGTCLPGIVLEVNSGFDTYQWLLNNVPITGANSNAFTPGTAGNYTVTVTNGSCPAVTTDPFTVLNCTGETSVTKTICNSFDITPKFTTSTQNVDINTEKITTQPANGVVVINATTGVITYTPNVGYSGPDSFKYIFYGNGTFPDSEEVTVNITVGQLKVQNASLSNCKINEIFILPNANITSNTLVTRKYYKTLQGAQTEDTTQEILNFTAYPSTGGDVYAVVKTPEGCSDIATITLGFFPEIFLDPSLYNAVNCDDDFDNKIDVDFSKITPIILQNSTYFQVRYYLKQEDAILGNGNTLPNNWSYYVDTPVFVRVNSPDNCPFKLAEIDFSIGTKLTLIKSSYPTSECDDDLDGIKSVDFSKYTSQFTTDSGVNVSYYNNLNDAKNSQNPVSNPVSVNKNGTYYLRLSEAGYCPVIATLTLTIKVPRASTILQDKDICLGTTTVLNAGPGFQSYLWSTGETTSTITAAVGDYYVDLEDANGCIYRQKVSVKEVDLPKITAINIQGSTVTITADGGNKPYYYSLNGSSPQTSNVFSNVSSGINTIYVTSADQCTPVSKEFSLIVITNTITPNGDNINDTFNYSDLKTKDNPKFQIFDRFGKLVFTGSADNNYTWDGTLNNRKLPTDSYWFILEWKEFGVATTVRSTGWVLLKNSNF